MDSADDSDNSFTFSKNEYNKPDSNTLKNNANHCSNIVHKLFNREIYGGITRKSHERSRKIFERIPPRLRFCLIDIVPMAYLREHVFMGFSQCGQFLLSFTYSCNTQVYFRESSKFTLHFLSWVPGRIVKPVHSVPLFGDDCVDSKVTISMAQWKHNPDVLVVYGIADSCSERSYLSVIGVPRLGCKKCAAYSRDEDDLNWGKRCLQHNFAIHTKFFCTSDSSMYEPVVQLAYSNQIIIYTDFIHILEVDFVKPDERNEGDECKYSLDREETNSIDTYPNTPASASDVSAAFQSPKYQNNVVQNILEDFSDLEMEPYQMSRPVHLPDVMGQELCIQASSISHNLVEEWEGPSPSIRTLISPPLRSPRRRPAESMSRFNEMHRVIADKAYEFVEEAETKCEKLSMFRKRRLADKKYEFSEDNNENIVPFRVLRNNRKIFIGNTSKNPPRRSKSPPVECVVLRAHNQISRPSSPTTSSGQKTNSLSLESDHNSESEYRVMEMLDDGSLKTVSVHDNTSKTLSDCPVNEQDPYLVHSENSKCSKFFTRYFVESDDEITSIITDSEDDCISGYHVALHLTAHGAGYAALQAVSSSAWERLQARHATLRAQQRSLDTELLCNEVCGRLCKINGKKFIYCFDWGCHVIDVCQSSGCLSGLCAMWMWASAAPGAGACAACGDAGAGCLLHRRQYAAECLFVWDLVSGVYRTERVSMTEDASQEGTRVSGAERARELAKRLGPIHMPPGNESRLLTTLTGRSLKRLTDVDNCIEITKNHPDSSESESSAEEESDSD
ncbi:uncharacterized protein LOC106143568 [Amyelois transitella]|uniref:uncharacterized protein LOC106143568 n=1 Tax=Amyelois transitella TaxID=680683 RepID=UPI00298FE3E5|nr:uncharacterized protein LOC106143568 [Amyelois transitella]